MATTHSTSTQHSLSWEHQFATCRRPKRAVQLAGADPAAAQRVWALAGDRIEGILRNSDLDKTSRARALQAAKQDILQAVRDSGTALRCDWRERGPPWLLGVSDVVGRGGEGLLFSGPWLLLSKELLLPCLHRQGGACRVGDSCFRGG